MTIGEKIKNMRQKLGYTQEQLAEKLVVSRQAIAKWETDRGIPDIENLKTVADFFGLSVDCLVNDSVTLTTEDMSDDQQTLPVEETLQSEAIEEDQDVKNQLPNILKNKKVFVPLICIIIGLISVLIIFSCIVPAVKQSANMRKAEDLMNSGDYLAAAKIYEGIDTQEAAEQYNVCMYLYSKKLYNDGKYEEAITQISNITYKDSATLLIEWKYEFALYNVKIGNYPKAIDLFKELDEYNGSKSKYTELCNYYGTKLYNEKKFNEAISYLESVPNASELYNKALYNKAVDLHNEGQLGEAFNLFRDLIKKGNANAANNAKHILNQILQDNMWNYSPVNNENTFTYIFSDFIKMDIWKGKFYFYVVEPDDSRENSFSFNSKVFTNETDTDAKWPIVLMGTNTQNSLDMIFLSFDYFSGNSKVYIHTHFLSDVENCSDFCGLYIADRAPDLSSYTTKYKYEFEPVELPQLSFSQEISQIEKEESNADNEDLLEKEENNENSNSNKVEPNSSNDTSSTNKEPSSSNSSNITNNSDTSSKPSSSNTTSSKPASSTQTTSKPAVTKDPCADGHSWKDATCTSPATCSVCKKTSGKALGHELYIAKCINCGQTDYSKLAGTYTDVGAWYSGTDEDVDMSSFTIDTSGILSFELDGQKYSLKVVQVNTSYYDEESNFVCYSLNGNKETDIKIRVVENHYISYPSNEPYDLFIFHFNWDYFNGRKLNFSGEKVVK